MSVGVFGAKTLISNLHKARKAADKAAEREVNRARLSIETTAKKLVARGPHTGEVYGKHQASAPGEAPATDTGTLLSSIESKIESDGFGKVSAVIWTEKEYGKWLEFGTVNMDARPWLTPATEQNRQRFPKVLGKAVIKSIDGAVTK